MGRNNSDTLSVRVALVVSFTCLFGPHDGKGKVGDGNLGGTPRPPFFVVVVVGSFFSFYFFLEDVGVDDK